MNIPLVIRVHRSLSLALFSPLAFAKNLVIDPTNIYPKVKLETSMGIIIVELGPC